MKDSFLAKITIAFLSVAIFFMAFESIQRIRYAIRYNDASWLRYGFLKKNVLNREGDLTPGRYGKFTINSKGFRGKEFDAPKKKGVFRIVAIGGSSTFGHEMTTDKTLTFKMEKICTRTQTGKEVEIINGGVPGKDSDYWAKKFKKRILSIDPDLILVYIGWNDLRDPITNILAVKEQRMNKLHKYFIKKSLFYMTLNEKISAHLKGNASHVYLKPKTEKDRIATIVEQEKEIMEKYEKNITKIILEAQKAGVLVALIKFPYLENSKLYLNADWVNGVKIIFKSIDKLSKNHNVPIIDCTSKFPKEDTDNLFLDFMHPSEKGNAFMAEIICQYLAQSKYL
ncbi:MAG: SGNH/GDSL hydrolase family protein [Candidatus Omnitrophica bacterium]|nr:SGNH/GDSL hydrolase family protein [Candidatus Omnitrophota bacterium]